MLETKKLSELLNRGVVEVIEREHLLQRLKDGDKLRVKFGIDPTTPDLHLGHTVPLRKLRQFQNLGHTAVLVIGDYTATIGDPSGQDKTRPALSPQQVKTNAKFYEQQALAILNPDQIEVRWQSQWFGKFDLRKVIELSSRVSTWHLLSHETFAKRKQLGQPLMAHEMLYPLLQGYDSVAVKADVELGGVDQKFNLLTGRLVQPAFGQPPQDILMTPYLVGTDGSKKMSKTYNNAINLNDSPDDVYGKVMSISDSVVPEYFELVTDLEFKALEKVKEELKTHPRDAKARLAFLIVEQLYDQPAAELAQAGFDRVFRQGKLPEKLPQFRVAQGSVGIVDLMVAASLAPSKQQATRLIEQGGVKVNGKKVSDPLSQVTVSSVIQVGKRRFVQLVRS